MLGVAYRHLFRAAARTAFRGPVGHNLAPGMTTAQAVINRGGQLNWSSRLFSISMSSQFPTAPKKATTTRSTTKKRATASATTKKAPAKKKKAPAKKTVATKAKTKTKVKAKVKAAPTKKKKPASEKKPAPATPRNTPSLRAPPRAMKAYSLFLQRIYPTITPRPVGAIEITKAVSPIWKALTEQEKEVFRQEAAIISAERQRAYIKWRESLTIAEVRTINAYNVKGGHKKLGRPVGSKRPASGFSAFVKAQAASGKVDYSQAPAGENKAVWGLREAAKQWKSLTEVQKAAYKKAN